MAERHDPLAALRQRGFLLFCGGRFFSTVAMRMVVAAVLWQVYETTGSAAMLGVVGLVQFLPSAMGLSLLGGAVADSYNRKRITLLCQSVQMLVGISLFLFARSGSDSVAIIFAIVFVNSLASGFEWPARQSLLPMVVKQETFGNAIVVSGALQQLSFLTGPPLAGFLIAWKGVELAYAAQAVMLIGSIALLSMLRPRADTSGKKRDVSVRAVKEGFRFVVSRQPIFGSMLLDMFAVIFGGATALLPIYAEEILHVGSLGYGFLFAAIDAGAAVTSVVMIWVPPVRNTGRTLLLAVAGFGLATIVFGLSRSCPLSLAACAFIGVSDQVSVVMRQTTIQLSTPDALRGRVTSVNMLFIGASNQLGTVESGFVAALTSATFAVASGGIGCLVVLAAVALALPEMRSFKLHEQPAGADPSGHPSREPAEAETASA